MQDYVSRSLFEMLPIGSGFFSKLGAHQTMLSDTVRCEAYKLALKKVIQ